MEETKPAVSDAIPRVSVEQLLDTLDLLAASERSTFDDVRALLQRTSSRNTAGSREAMWTSARDALAELQRLGFAKAGPLPRRRSEVERLRGSPCQATESGLEMATLRREKASRAYDALLITWANVHPYFRAFLARLTAGPLFVPDVTSVKQVGEHDPTASAEIAQRIIDDAMPRLSRVGVAEAIRTRYEAAVRERIKELKLPDRDALRTDSKQWVDLLEDAVVLPAFLFAEALPFDAVTFQHLIRISQQFLCASWTSSLPGFTGRVVYLTSDFSPSLTGTDRIESVVHHGKTWAADRFETAIVEKYVALAEGQRAPYVDAYALRASVCVDLCIQPKVFAVCFQDLARQAHLGRVVVYTELPMRPPPQGESYVELAGQQRVGLVKLVVQTGEDKNHGTPFVS